MGLQAIINSMFAFRLLIHTPMGLRPTFSIASTTDGYSYYAHAPCFSVIPVIHRSSRLWKPSRTKRISPVTTQLFLLYKSTKCTTALYIFPCYHTVAPVLFQKPRYHPPPPLRFPQVLVDRRQIAVIVGTCLA